MAITLADMAVRLGRARPTILGHLRRLAVRPIGKGGRGGKAYLYPDDTLDLLAEALRESPLRARRAKPGGREANPPPPAIPAAQPTWQMFEAQCRVLARTCAALRITNVSIETPMGGKQKVEFEQASTGEVTL